MKRNQTTLTKVILASLLLWTIPMFATTYEDAEDNTTIGWVIYGDTDSATVANIYDSDRESRVIELTGNGKETGYRLGDLAGQADAWNNTKEKTIQWSMNYSESFTIYVSILTEEGNRYLVYNNQGTDKQGIIRGAKVRYGLGEDSADGIWHTFTRDLEADWNTFVPDNHIISVNGFFIRGSGKVDDISLLPTDLTLNNIYEDGEDNETTGWVIYSNPNDATVENVSDVARGSQVIQLTGNGLETGYRLGNRSGRGESDAWNNYTNRILQWSMNYNEDFIIYISILTEQGNRYLVYSNKSTDEQGIIRGGKVHYGLGEDSINGIWHTFTRDLEADWNAFEPNNSIISVNGFFIRGSGRVDDIFLSPISQF